MPDQIPNRLLSKPVVGLFLAAITCIGVSTWIVYGRAIASPFIFDDGKGVAENTSIINLWPLVGDAEHPAPFNPPADLPTSGRPLVNLSLALNYYFGGLNPVGYHVFNLVVHGLSALLLMAIVRRTLLLEYFEGRFTEVAGWLSLAVAILWAVHPLQTETVVYVTQRTELLVSCAYLLTLYGSMRYWATSSLFGRIAWLTISTLACLCGMACKEVMATAPVVVLLFERTFISGSFRQALCKSWSLYIGLALGWGFLFWLNFSSPRSQSAGFHLGVSATSWWLTQTEVLWMYLKLAIWPWPLTIHYELRYLTTVIAAWPWLLPTILLGVAVAILLWKRYAVGFVGAWVLLILSPTLVVPILTEVAAERRMYLPLAAMAAMLVVGGYWLTQLALADRSKPLGIGGAFRWRPLGVVISSSVVLAVVFGLLSWRRLAVYVDPVALWQDTLAKYPTSWLAEDNLGSALLDAGQLPQAIEHYEQALQLNPDYILGLNNLGNALVKKGDLQGATKQFEHALRLNPGYSKPHFNLGNVLKQSGRTEEAIDQYVQALTLEPDYVKAHNNLGNALKQLGRFPEAIEHYRRALELHPKYTEAWINLASAYAETNRMEEAVASGKRALSLARSQGQAALVQRMEAWLASHSGDLPNTEPAPQRENGVEQK